jgi:hypothetical protein
MRRYSGLHALALSFFSPRLYRDVAARWYGTGVLYLLILCALAWVPLSIKAHLAARRFASDDFPGMSRDLPPVTVRDGQASSPVAQPYVIPDAAGQALFVLDTSSTAPAEARYALTRDQLRLRSPAGHVRTLSLRHVPDLSLDRDKLDGYVQAFAPWFGIALYPVGVLGTFLLAAVVNLVLATVALVVSTVGRKQLGFKTLYRLSAVAMTPAVIVATALMFVPLVLVPATFLAVVALLMIGYATFAVASRRSPIASVDDEASDADFRIAAAPNRYRESA